MRYIKYILWFLIGIISGFFLITFLKLFLPSVPLKYDIKKTSEIFNINLSKIFKVFYQTPLNISPLKGVSLKALYKDNDKGFVIIYDKKNIFIDLNGYYKGYKLVTINKNSAIFEKNSKKYILKFKNTNNNFTNISESEKVKIKKSYIKSVKNNPLKIWNNINIINTPNGYKITYIKPHSIFDKIGLKTGDIIIAVNNKKLNDNLAWKLYKNIEKYEDLDITIKRNNTIKVIRYEIN